MSVCQKCGLPEELCACESIAKRTQQVKVALARRKWGKEATIVSGIEDKSIDLQGLMKQLKKKLACGGTIKEGVIILMGNHKQGTIDTLKRMGFAVEESKKSFK